MREILNLEDNAYLFWKTFDCLLYVVVLLLLAASFLLLIKMSRTELLLPRPKYVHRDAKFTSYDLGQNWSWDWCLCFRVRPETEALAYDARTARFTLRYVVERLELAGLETKLFRSVDRGLIFVKIRATALRLKEEAARTEYGLKLEPREVVRRVERGYRDALGQYVWYPRRDGWTLPDVPGRVFNTAIVDSEGQSPFAYEAYAFGRYDRRADVQSAYATYLPSNSIFRGVDRLKLIKSIMEADGKNRGAQIKLGELLAKDALRAAYPLHNAGEVAALTDRWLTYATPPWRMPVDAIKDYYGEKIGTYFHFLGHYTTWLAIAAARAELDRRFGGSPPNFRTLHLGHIDVDSADFWTHRVLSSSSRSRAESLASKRSHIEVGLTSDSSSAQAAGVGIATYLALLFGRGSGGVLLPLYALFVSLWVTGFLESWKSAEATMAMRWGMSDFKTYEQNRPQFVGREIHSPVTGMPEVYFPRREQLVLRAKSYLVVAAALVALVGAFACVFAFQGYMTARPWAFQMDADQELYEATGRQPGAVMSEVLLAVVVIAACDGFIPVAERLTEYENHRTDSLFENHLIGKVFVFHFIASYAPFFYLALGRDFMPGATRDRKWGCSPGSDGCFRDVSSQLACIYLVRVVAHAWAEVWAPWFRKKLSLEGLARETGGRDADEYVDPTGPRPRKRQLSPVEEQFRKAEYHHLLGSFGDYAELVIQFGYTTLFVTAFPLAPLFAFVNNFIEIRTDGFTLLHHTRRPWPTGASDIGIWMSFLEFMSNASAVTNAVLVAYTHDSFENLTTVTRLLLFACYEYALIGLKLTYQITVDDVPDHVVLQVARSDFLSRKIVSNERDEQKGAVDVDAVVETTVVHQSDPEMAGDGANLA